MKTVLLYCLIFLLYSSVNSVNESKMDSNEKTHIEIVDTVNLQVENLSDSLQFTKSLNEIFIDSTNFKYVNLTEFDLRNWSYGKIVEELKPFKTKTEISRHFQNKNLNDYNLYPDSYRYFSLQKNDDSLKIITVL